MNIKEFKMSMKFQPKEYSSSEAEKILRTYKVIDSKGQISPKYSDILKKSK